MDLRKLTKAEPVKPFGVGTKRYQPTLENIPSKRLKTTITKPTITKPVVSRTINVKTEEKKKAILSAVKSTALTKSVTSLKTSVAAPKPPLIKSSSTGSAKPPTVASKVTANKSAIVATSKNIAAKPTISKFDFKGRFNLLKERFDELKSKSEQQKDQICMLEEQNETHCTREKELIEKIEKLEQELFDITEIKEELENKLETIRSSYETQIQSLKQDKSNLVMKNTALSLDLNAKCEVLTTVKKRLDDLTIKHEKQTVEYEELQQMSGTLKQDFEKATSQLILSQDQLYHINIERKVLHNMVLDLRGNIRVFARVRPPIDMEDDRILCSWSFNDETSLEINSNELVPANARRQTKHEFSFDQVFDPNTTQEEIFENVAPLIQSALDGYNVCIFAYGQTGSGKTFTMDGHDSKLGIIPRTVKLLFDAAKNAEVLGWHYKITASFLEIYNEVLYDLLSNETKDIEIRMANAKSKTEIYVSNLTEVEVTTAARLHELMSIARSNRATAATTGNERSSRSHAVTRLEITGRHESKPENLIGMINLVDLAGSESPKTSTRMDETKNINRSLSELSNVILALVQKNEHIPYRNSKLTHLLMPSLGGNSKTLMFVNVSPFQDCFVESVKSLRFAAQVNSCKLAKAKRNRQLNSSNVF